MIVRAPTVEDIEWGECLLERRPDPAITAHVRKCMGRVPDYIDYFTPCPWLARNVTFMTASRVGLMHIDQAFSHLLSAVVSQDNSCRYCYASHRALLAILGLAETRIRAVETDLLTGDLTAAERAALDFARRLSRFNPAPGTADRRRLMELGYSEDAYREIVFVAAVTVMANCFSTLPALPTSTVENLPRRPHVRLLRPLLARRLHAWFRRGKLRPLPPGALDGPFGFVVARLDGLAVAAELASVLDEAWHSGILTCRAKAIVFAVVARALACPSAEAEARRLAADEGFTGAMVDDVLANLAAAELDEVERVIVPFARETVRYQTRQIQRRAAVIRRDLTAEQFVELIGITALANAVCRLTVLADDG